MLTKLPLSALPTITKQVNGADASERGAFAYGDRICITVEVPRCLGASAVVLRIAADGGKETDLPLQFTDSADGVDGYCLTLDTVSLCGAEERGLFFYELLFLRGADTLFTDTRNQVDFDLTAHSARKFVLLISKADYQTPAWLHGKTMYHIFVDRFCRGSGPVAKRQDVILNEDWDNGIPQYAEKNGDPLANNMFFGGNLWGIAEKLDHLKSLGVGVLYLSPIFRAYSNHKYDTGDYLEIDGMFGGEDAFRHLLRRAKEAGIRIVLDGVFNHTGDNSRYFDRYGTYGNSGAYSDPDSVYRDWFSFRHYPTDYETWWGIPILPKLNLQNDACRNFLVGKDGVVARYVRMGIDGWRLDVADELPDRFLEQLRQTVKQASDGEAVIIGEVWENAALKEAYGARRHYFDGNQLDSVMNYPLRNGILYYLLEGDATVLADILKEIYATYPKCVCDSLMNLLGTHDTERILTVLGEDGDRSEEKSNAQLATKRLSEEQYRKGVSRLKLAAAIQYTVYGIPSVFYGDEAGLEGYHDPFCRRPYPWGREDRELLTFYQALGHIRSTHAVFVDGRFRVLAAEGTLLVYERRSSDEQIVVAVNGGDADRRYPLAGIYTDLLTDSVYDGSLPPYSVKILQKHDGRKGKHGTVR